MFTKSATTTKTTLSRFVLSATTLAVVVASSSFSLSTPSQAARDYVMTCRAGGSMQAIAGQRVSSREAFVSITFRGGMMGAAVRPPRPGECTWIDRGFRRGEPTKLIYKENGSWVQSVCNAHKCDTRTNSRSIQSLMIAVRDKKTFQVHARNDGRGNMVVSRVGP